MHHPDQPHSEARAALATIADSRDALADDRRRWVATAWRGGDRNINGLSAAARVARNTIYADLQALGLDRSTPITEEN